VGERRRAASDEKFKQERRRETAHLRLKKALKHLAEVTKERPMLTAEKTIAEAAQIELLYRLQDDPAAMTDQTLNRVKDSAINSVARIEQWDRAKGTDPRDALSAITTQMSRLRGKLKIEVSVDPDPEVIDVTPERQNLDAPDFSV
jgi:hypothetical protein